MWQVVLETEITNTGAIKLYERLGFLRSKRLHRYYLNGNSAYRLVLYLKDSVGPSRTGCDHDQPPHPVRVDSAPVDGTQENRGTCCST